MPVVSFSILWTILIDIFAWTFFHLFISFICYKLPLAYFQKDSFLFRTFSWEQSGRMWQRRLKVKNWKDSLIDGTDLGGKGYNKKRLHGTKAEELEVFASETKRAELIHWLSILPAPLFFLWNPLWVGWMMIAYAIVFNLPYIIIQRYNRGRIMATMER